MKHNPNQAANGPSAETPAAEAHDRRRRLSLLIRDQRLRRRLILVLCLAAVFVGGLLAALVRATEVLPLDLLTTRDLQLLAPAWFRPLMIAVSAPGYRPWSLLVTSAGVLLIGLLLGLRDAAYLLAMTLIQGLTNLVIKAAIGRPRPASSLVDVFAPFQGASFPSGHVMFYTVFFGLLGFLVGLRLPRSSGRVVLVGLCVALIVLVGPSRIYLGVHWLSDVVGAYLLGVAILALAIEFYLVRVAPRR